MGQNEKIDRIAVRTRWVDYKDKEFDPYVLIIQKLRRLDADCLETQVTD